MQNWQGGDEYKVRNDCQMTYKVQPIQGNEWQDKMKVLKKIVRELCRDYVKQVLHAFKKCLPFSLLFC